MDFRLDARHKHKPKPETGIRHESIFQPSRHWRGRTARHFQPGFGSRQAGEIKSGRQLGESRWAQVDHLIDERLVPAFSKFTVSMPAHAGMAVPVKTTVSPDGKRIVGSLPTRLSAGTYKISWTAATADDGHKITGELSFKVG
jgi:hypothetical protein